MPDPASRIRALLESLVATTDEVGLQAAAYVDGELVVDAWAGLANPPTGAAVRGDTLFLLSSCSKGVAATCLHLLVERGQLAYDDPISIAKPAAHSTIRSPHTRRLRSAQTR
jgi:CubicO group peptidase (beta-lactamase class C family)